MNRTRQHDLDLPIHPTMRHPLTGQPLRALGVMPSGRIVWPMMGASPDDGSNGGDGGEGGQGGGQGAGAGGNGGSGGGTSAGRSSSELGFPENTPVAEMNHQEQAAYWKHQSRKHENNYKNLTGGRPGEDVKKDLDAYAEVLKAQQTPAEQALTDAREAGRKEASAASRRETAQTLFRVALEANGVTGDELDELAANFNVDGFIADDKVDTTKITNFAKKFVAPSTGRNNGPQQRKDFGGGRRHNTGGDGQETSSAQQAAQKRGFIKST